MFVTVSEKVSSGCREMVTGALAVAVAPWALLSLAEQTESVGAMRRVLSPPASDTVCGYPLAGVPPIVQLTAIAKCLPAACAVSPVIALLITSGRFPVAPPFGSVTVPWSVTPPQFVTFVQVRFAGIAVTFTSYCRSAKATRSGRVAGSGKRIASLPGCGAGIAAVVVPAQPVLPQELGAAVPVPWKENHPAQASCAED